MPDNNRVSFEDVIPDFFTEIGRVAVLQSEVEGCLRIIIGNLTGMDEPTACAVTSRLSFRHLTSIVESLLALRAKEISHEDTQFTIEAITRSRAAEAKRNSYVHSMWGFGPNVDPALATRVKLSGNPPELKAHTISIDDARKLRNEMQEVADSLMYVHPRLRVPPNTGLPPSR